MSRRKGTITKIVKDGTPIERLRGYRYGNADAYAAKLTDKMAGEFKIADPNFLQLVKGATAEEMKTFRQMHSDAKTLVRLFGEFLSDQFKNALNTGDASLFRKLADTAERYKEPCDRDRLEMARDTLMRKTPGDWPSLTAGEWLAYYNKKSGKQKSIRQFRKEAEECGLPIKAGKPGRPKK